MLYKTNILEITPLNKGRISHGFSSMAIKRADKKNLNFLEGRYYS
jgi:hypothetical protein